MNNKGYFVVHEWMVTDLGLKGTELLVYAIIYGFTQIEEQHFFGSRQYIADFIGVTVRSVQNALDSLVLSGHLTKGIVLVPYSGIKAVSYRANFTPSENISQENFSPNNIHNKSSTVVRVTKGGINRSSTVRFIKPTVEEIAAYCYEHGYRIDPEAFYDYYESKGWLVGRSPMKDWKAAVRTWVKNDRSRSGIPSHENQPDWGDD